MEIKELRESIAVSLFLSPCTEEELGKRDFFKNISNYGIGMQLQKLDFLEATYYKGDVIGSIGIAGGGSPENDDTIAKSAIIPEIGLTTNK